MGKKKRIKKMLKFLRNVLLWLWECLFRCLKCLLWKEFYVKIVFYVGDLMVEFWYF